MQRSSSELDQRITLIDDYAQTYSIPQQLVARMKFYLSIRSAGGPLVRSLDTSNES